MRKTTSKVLAVLATSAALTVTGAGLASADSGSHDESRTDVNNTRHTDVRDSGNISLQDLVDLGVDVGGVDLGDIAVLNGNDADVSDIGNGNANGNESNSSSGSSSGLLGGLL
ncbi:MAG: hypothetical protein ACTH2Q_09140 [Propionibacteriaceae bacterium]